MYPVIRILINIENDCRRFAEFSLGCGYKFITMKGEVAPHLTVLRRWCMRPMNSFGVVYPTVSGTLMVVAPAAMATEYT